MTQPPAQAKAKIAWIIVSTIMLIAAVWFDLYQSTVQQRILLELKTAATRSDSVRELLFRKIASMDSMTNTNDSLIIRQLQK